MSFSPAWASFSSSWAVGSILILFVHFFTYAPSWFYRQGVRFRLKGAFEDPNVLGPFLILPIIYFIECEKGWRKAFALPPLLLLILTYSRGAWVAMAVAIVVLVSGRRIFRIGTTTRALLLLLALIASAIVLVQISGVGDRIVAGIEVRSRIQSYDVQRFDVLGESVKEGLASPMELGAGEFRQKYGISAHDLFLGKAVDAGIIPAVMMVSLVVLAAYRLFKARRKSGDQLSFVLLIALAAQMATSTTIYSHHWRHLWVIVVLGLARTHTLKELENVPPAVLPGTGPVAAPSPVS